MLADEAGASEMDKQRRHWGWPLSKEVMALFFCLDYVGLTFSIAGSYFRLEIGSCSDHIRGLVGEGRTERAILTHGR